MALGRSAPSRKPGRGTALHFTSGRVSALHCTAHLAEALGRRQPDGVQQAREHGVQEPEDGVGEEGGGRLGPLKQQLHTPQGRLTF